MCDGPQTAKEVRVARRGKGSDVREVEPNFLDRKELQWSRLLSPVPIPVCLTLDQSQDSCNDKEGERDVR